MMDTVLVKAEGMVSSIEAKREKPPIVEAGYRLIQNWLFSIISDQEKCVRYARMKASKEIEHI